MQNTMHGANCSSACMRVALPRQGGIGSGIGVGHCWRCCEWFKDSGVLCDSTEPSARSCAAGMCSELLPGGVFSCSYKSNCKAAVSKWSRARSSKVNSAGAVGKLLEPSSAGVRAWYRDKTYDCGDFASTTVLRHCALVHST